MQTCHIIFDPLYKSKRCNHRFTAAYPPKQLTRQHWHNKKNISKHDPRHSLRSIDKSNTKLPDLKLSVVAQVSEQYFALICTLIKSNCKQKKRKYINVLYGEMQMSIPCSQIAVQQSSSLSETQIQVPYLCYNNESGGDEYTSTELVVVKAGRAPAAMHSAGVNIGQDTKPAMGSRMADCLHLRIMR